MVEVRGVEPLCPGPSRATSTGVASCFLSPVAHQAASASTGQSCLKILQRRHDGRHRYSCCRRSYPLAGVMVGTWPHLSSQGHFFVGAVYLFRRGISERPSALDRQLRTPTKGRIRNTPKRGKVKVRGKVKGTRRLTRAHDQRTRNSEGADASRDCKSAGGPRRNPRAACALRRSESSFRQTGQPGSGPAPKATWTELIVLRGPSAGSANCRRAFPPVDCVI
jgi:hypothetical protein